MQRSARMKKEIKMLTETPPHGISCWPKDDTLNALEARELHIYFVHLESFSQKGASSGLEWVIRTKYRSVKEPLLCTCGG